MKFKHGDRVRFKVSFFSTRAGDIGTVATSEDKGGIGVYPDIWRGGTVEGGWEPGKAWYMSSDVNGKLELVEAAPKNKKKKIVQSDDYWST
jgi:hypothetical protein